VPECASVQNVSLDRRKWGRLPFRRLRVSVEPFVHDLAGIGRSRTRQIVFPCENPGSLLYVRHAGSGTTRIEVSPIGCCRP
jgi:hypothetical protein